MEASESMRDVIKLYKYMPELWNPKFDNYKNKKIRRISMDRLLLEYKKIKADANVLDLKNRIHNMRTSYKRELRKTINSHRTAACLDDIYVSKLWYFNDFDFLKELEQPLSEQSILSSDEGEDPLFMPKRKEPKRTAAAESRDDSIKIATDHLPKEQPKDYADTFGSSWACMFREADPEQQMFAKQAIEEILVLARLKKLSLNYLHQAGPVYADQSNFESPVMKYESGTE